MTMYRSGAHGQAVAGIAGTPCVPSRLVVIGPDAAPLGTIGKQLSDLGFEPVHVRETDDALDEIDATAMSIDAVLLDWRHDGDKTFAFAEKLARRSAENGIPVLTLAALGRPEDIRLALEAGLFNVMPMPCLPAELKAAIDGLTRHSQAARQTVSLDLENAL
ncbi:MAG: hypothetical protein HC850_14110, partial [Rhodomicrobium sp.]|nr:hypothetical protein [Rhodomicrobium sp.]